MPRLRPLIIMLALVAGTACGAEPALKLPPPEAATRKLGDFAIAHRTEDLPPRNKVFLMDLDRPEYRALTQGERLTTLRAPGGRDGDEIILIEGKPVAGMSDSEWQRALLRPDRRATLVVRTPGSREARAVVA